MKQKTGIFLILALLLGVGLGSAGTFWAQKSIFKTQSSYSSQSNEEGPLLSLGELLVNLQGGAILKTTISVEAADAKTLTQLKAEDAFLKDRVNSVLLNRPLADVQTPDNLAKLKTELIKSLNQVSNGRITNVLFEKIVYQQ
jgi:flagellar protein FliL